MYNFEFDPSPLCLGLLKKPLISPR